MGHSTLNLEQVEEAGDTSLTEAFLQGKHLGQVDLHVLDETPRFQDRGLGAQLRVVLEDHRRQVGEYKKRMAEDPSGALRPYYEQTVRNLEDSIAREQKALAALPTKVTGNWFENRTLPLDQAIPDQPGLALLVHQYNQESERRAAKRLPVGIAHLPKTPVAGQPDPHHQPVAAAAADPAHEALTYAGTNTCGNCHATQLAHWKTTKHAHAIATLQKKGRAKDPSCIGCHTTGYLQAGGTRFAAAALDRFADVGCESCHGPSLAHITTEDRKQGTRRKVEETVCRGCHTPDQTNNEFDYALFTKAILGPGHGFPAPAAPAAPPAKAAK
jgi:hypothetical protein